LGLEFARQYKAENWKVIACCRNPETATELAKADVSIRKLDLLDFGEFNNFAQSLDGVPIDLLINNAAIIDRSKRIGSEDTGCRCGGENGGKSSARRF
jgi:short-subunit dehydrogenase